MRALFTTLYKNWFFDLDGTLADTVGDILPLLNAALEAFGHAPCVRRENIGPPLEDIVRNACPGIAEDRLRELVNWYIPRYRASSFARTQVYEGIPALLARLRQEGRSVFLATNKPEGITARLLEAKKLTPFLNDVVCRDSVPGRQLAKTDMLSLLLSRHGLEARDSVMVGDSLFDMTGGRASGMATAAVLYGYGERQKLLTFRPDHVVEAPDWAPVLFAESADAHKRQA